MDDEAKVTAPLLPPKKPSAEEDEFDLLEQSGFGCFQLMMMASSALCWITCAIAYESISWQVLFLETSMQAGFGVLGLVTTPLGVLLASPVIGTMSDQQGRSFSILASCVLTMAIYAGSFTQNPDGFIMFRFLIGVAITGLEAIPSVLVLETCPKAYRASIRPMLHVFWHFGSVAVIVIGTFVMDTDGGYNTFNYYVAIVICSMIALMMPFFLWIESPCQLVGKRDYTGARRNLSKIAWMNGKTLAPEDVQLVESKGDEQTTMELLGGLSGNTRLCAFILCVIFFSQTSAYLLWMTSMVQYLKSLDMVEKTPEVFSSTPMGRLAGACVSVVLPQYFSLELLIMVGSMSAGICGLLTMIFSDWMFWTSFGFWFTLEIVFCCVFSYAPLAFPPALRARALAVLMAVGDIGDIILTLVGQSLTSMYVGIPLAISFGLMAPISLCAFFLWRGKDSYRSADSISVGGSSH